MKKGIRNKRLWYIAAIILFVLLTGIDIIKFRIKNKKDITTEETTISTTEEADEETVTEENTEVKEGTDDDYKYQEGTGATTQEELVADYEDFFEEFDTEK